MMGSDGLSLASRLRRLIATSIDAILVPSLTLVLVMITGVVEDAEDFGDSWWLLQVFLLAVTSYLSLNGYSLWRRGQTLGKLLTGIAVISAIDGKEGQHAWIPAPLWKLVFIRALFFPLLFVAIIPWLAPLPVIDQLFIFNKQRRCLHDLVSGTTVVRL
tara:strand:+ start:729 stop:1205 length:477 start_codon:yes stop_codon:yes gene_type:complete